MNQMVVFFVFACLTPVQIAINSIYGELSVRIILELRQQVCLGNAVSSISPS